MGKNKNKKSSRRTKTETLAALDEQVLRGASGGDGGSTTGQGPNFGNGSTQAARLMSSVRLSGVRSGAAN